MKSTGEVMGAYADLGSHAKARLAPSIRFHQGEFVFSVNDRDKDRAVPIACDLSERFVIHATCELSSVC